MSPVVLLSNTLTLVGLAIIILVVSVKNYRAKINRWFIAFALSVFLYTAASFASEFPSDLNSALFWARTSLMLANFIPFFFYLFSLAFTGRRIKLDIVNSLLLAIPVVLAPIAYLPQTIGAVERTKYGTLLSQTGPPLWLTLIYFVVAISLSMYNFNRYGQTAGHAAKLQARLISYGMGITVALNMITQIVLPEFGVNALGNLVGTPSLLILVGSVGYAIVRHKLFDIKAVILRSLGYVVTIGLITVFYSLLILVGQKLLFPALMLSVVQNVYFISAAVLLTLLFRPLMLEVGKFTDRIFFRDRYDAPELINQIGRVLVSVAALETLSILVRSLLTRHMRVSQTDILVLEGNEIYFESAGIFVNTMPRLTSDLAQLGNNTLVTDDLDDNEKKRILRTYNISVFAVLKNREEKIGYLLFGEKNSGGNYTYEDLGVINIIADELAIAIQNRRDYAQIQDFNKTLQHKIEEATEQLQDANAKLKKADQVKDEFISIASHQLLTPLAVVSGYLELATKTYVGKLNDKLEHLLSSALDRTSLMKGMVDDLLNISRMAAGKFHLELTTTDLNEVIPIEVEQLQNQATEKATTLTYHEPPVPVPVIEADAPKLRQAAMNLVANALQYSPGGKVDVYLELREGRIVFRVVDNGIGVPLEQQAQLFTKFFRADNAKKERPTGNGIGLYLVKRVVEDHGGSIIFTSKPGKGSTFGFSIPAKQQNNSSSKTISISTSDSA